MDRLPPAHTPTGDRACTQACAPTWTRTHPLSSWVGCSTAAPRRPGSEAIGFPRVLPSGRGGPLAQLGICWKKEPVISTTPETGPGAALVVTTRLSQSHGRGVRESKCRRRCRFLTSGTPWPSVCWLIKRDSEARPPN
ncbi:hypothetical protein D623_10006509 [Myotis brandtii]|uniref:Uncharacterized protein n=1 Tax=Myotis brandtii TaxID=109478 RepID=S7MNM0_MYOBR|nr:hypothetical protein D623_10006509 [Myotis brandtii]